MNLSPYIEKLVVRRKDNKDYAMLCCVPVAATLVIFALLKILPARMIALGAALVVVVGYLMYYAIKMIYLEYEYAITMGDIDIDSIRGQKKRVRVYSGNLTNIEEMAPFYPGDSMAKWDSIPVKIEAVSDIQAEDIYYFIGSYNGRRTLVLFQPSLEMLEACRLYMGRKLTVRPGDEILMGARNEVQE